MYYIIGWDQEGKLHMLAKATNLETITFMRGGYKAGTKPNDFAVIIVVQEITLPGQT